MRISGENGHQVMTELVDFMTHDAEFGTSMEANLSRLNYANISDYTEDLRSGVCLGDDITLQALASKYSRLVVVYPFDGTVQPTIFFPTEVLDERYWWGGCLWSLFLHLFFYFLKAHQFGCSQQRPL